LFSRHFAGPQPDWPPDVTTTGFVFYDRLGVGFQSALERHTNSELMNFLDTGSPPILFTLGSSAVMRPGRFYEESLAAARILARRAILLIGTNELDQLSVPVPDSAFVADYVPHSEVMPRCAAVVHQGGIGTTAQTLRSGRPMLVVPWAHDQPDNAGRIRKLGVGAELARNEYRAETAARKLEALLNDASVERRAAKLGEMIRGEDGLGAACEAIERTLRKL
jgi:UDP:flavonoid glycosyltransferase YjiC (YdhE family)